MINASVVVDDLAALHTGCLLFIICRQIEISVPAEVQRPSQGIRLMLYNIIHVFVISPLRLRRAAS